MSQKNEARDETEFRMKKPGATHHARFMGKSLYILKIFILSHLFARLTPRQTDLIQRLTLLIVTLFGIFFFLQSSLAPNT